MNRKFVIAAVFVMFAGIFTAAHAVNPPADIVFIIDESGSMQNDINEVRNNVNTIAVQLGASLDPQYALVEFGGQSSGPGNPGLTTGLTNAAGLSTALATLVASGYYEAGVESTIFAHNNVNFRTGSGVCYVLITDEDSDGGNLATAVGLLQTQNATWFGIVNPGAGNTATTYGPNAGSLSQATGGNIFSINDFRVNSQPVLNALLTSCIGSIIEPIILTPPFAVNPEGTTHTVTATVRDNLANPVAGVTVTFTIISGPNMGDTGTAVTDVNGEASITYTGDGGAGTDIIEGSFTDSNTQQIKTDTAEKVWDSTPPTCFLQNIVIGPPTTYIEVFTEDNESGLASINILQDDNATVTIPSFNAGTTDPVIVIGDKDDETLVSQIMLEVKDRAGNSTICDPIITLEIRETGKPVSHTFNGIPQVESKINVKNGDPGIKNLEIVVNGNKHNVAGLKDNEVRFLDVADDMVEGDDNTITLTAKGKPGGSVTVVISD